MSNWPGDAAVFPLTTPIIKQFEGFRAAPYHDSVGVATIGYGTILYPNGKSVSMNDAPVTEAQAETYLSYEMSLKSAVVAQMLQKPATLHQAAALLSLAYNIGIAHFHSSTVLRDFNKGDIAGAAEAFLLWDKGTVGGHLVVIPGLHNRRVAERVIFLTADS